MGAKMPHGADWTGSVRAIDVLDTETRHQLRALTYSVSASEGTRIFSEGSPCQAYLILLSGQLRVRKLGENGREIVLYRVEPGETCIITTACLMAETGYDAEGIAETDIEAQALPMRAFKDLLAQSASFRAFVFRAYGTRLADLLMLIEEVAFGRIDRRLATHLLERGRGRPEIRITHQDLAMELGTAREVVSRQLKDFEHHGWLTLARGAIRFENIAGLESLTQTIRPVCD